MTYELNLDSIANIAVQDDVDQGLHVVLAEVERDALVAEVRRLRRALIDASHTPWCATNCQVATHDCDCGWQDAVQPLLPSAAEMRGILAPPGSNAAALRDLEETDA